MEEASTNELVDLDTLVKRLEMPKAWLRKRANEGVIPCLRIGMSTKYNLEAVKAAILEAATRPSPRAPVRPKQAEQSSPEPEQLQAAS